VQRALRGLVASAWAPWVLLALSLSAHVLVTLAGADPFRMVDLKVYVDGTAHLTDGTLYDFYSEPLHLPFTYPAFSALVFALVGWLNWTVLRIIWQLASVAAVSYLVYATLRLLGRIGPGSVRSIGQPTGVVVSVTAVGLWLEPVRTTFNYGQINLFLAALLLSGAVSARSWWQGTTVGLAAGIKLVPAITGLYYLLQRRFAAVLWAMGIFLATVALSLAILPQQTWRYFTELIFDPGRTGPVWSAINQSWRGALARLAGHEVTGVWAIACVVTLVLGVWATVLCLRTGDRTGAFLSVQLVGLLVSPISWSHHWVWVLPVLIWAFAGPHRHSWATRGIAIGWLVGCYSYLVPILIVAQGPGTPPASRPGWQSWLGLVYVLLGMATLVVMALLAKTPLSRPRTAEDVVADAPT
jgi:alpha-1,2-mannosyltransferase